MNSKDPTILIYSSLAQTAYKRIIKSKPNINLNLILLSLLKWLPICFASIWYNDQKTPNYWGLIMALFWYSFSNQFIRYRKLRHQISLTEQYYQYFLQILTRLGLVRFISETLEISYYRETIIIIMAALIVQIFQFFLKNQFKTKNNLLRFIEYQWVLFMQVFLFLHDFSVQTGISFPFTAPVVQMFLLVHFLWFIHLAYQFICQVKLRWHLKQKKLQYIKTIIIILALLYVPVSIYVLKTHIYSGVGFRLYLQAISALIVAGYLSKKCVQKKINLIKCRSFNLNIFVYIIAIVRFEVYYIYYFKIEGEWQNNNFFDILTLLFVFSILSTLRDFYKIKQIIAKAEGIET